MLILETRSKVKVTVTGKWNVTIRHFKMHSQTKLPSKVHLHNKFGIPTLKKVRDVLQTRILKTWSKVNVTVTRKWYVTLRHPKISTPNLEFLPQRIYNSKQFLETRSEVKVNVTGTQGWCATLYHPKMHQHTKFGIPTSNDIGDML